MSDQQIIKTTVRHMVNFLVNGDYKSVERISKGCRLTEQEIADAVSDYGETFIMPPDAAFDNLDIIKQDSENQRSWSVNVDLWTNESGKSDLTLELTLIDSGKQICDVEINGIHAL